MRTLSSLKTEKLAIKSSLSGIAAVERLESELLKMPQVDIPTKEYYGHKVYSREIFLKAGSVAVGRTHKYDHISILISGRMTIWTPTHGVHVVQGPSVTEAKAGMKRAGYAHTDVHWVTAHYFDDIGDPFEILTIGRYSDYLQYIES